MSIRPKTGLFIRNVNPRGRNKWGAACGLSALRLQLVQRDLRRVCRPCVCGPAGSVPGLYGLTARSQRIPAGFQRKSRDYCRGPQKEGHRLAGAEKQEGPLAGAWYVTAAGASNICALLKGGRVRRQCAAFSVRPFGILSITRIRRDMGVHFRPAVVHTSVRGAGFRPSIFGLSGFCTFLLARRLCIIIMSRARMTRTDSKCPLTQFFTRKTLFSVYLVIFCSFVVFLIVFVVFT